MFRPEIAQLGYQKVFKFTSLNFSVKFAVIHSASLQFSAQIFPATLLISALKLLVTLDSKSCNCLTDKFTFSIILTAPDPSTALLSPT